MAALAAPLRAAETWDNLPYWTCPTPAVVSDVVAAGTAKNMLIIGDSQESTDFAAFLDGIEDELPDMTVTSIAVGGTAMNDFLADGDSPGLITAANPDIVLVGFGVNDSVFGVTAAQFKTNGALLIAMIRTATANDLTIPIVFTTDAYFANGSSETNAQFDQYPGVAAELAVEYPGVVALNEHRFLYDRGLTPAGYGDWYYDGVHYGTPGNVRRAHELCNRLRSIRGGRESAVRDRDGRRIMVGGQELNLGG